MGTKKRNGTTGEIEQIPWRSDPSVIERMREGWQLRARGLSVAEIALRQGVVEETIRLDRQRFLALAQEEARDAREEHVENLRALWKQVHEMLDSTDQRSLNRSALAGQLRQIEMDIARLDGSLVERREDKVNLDGVSFTLNLKPE